MTAKLRRKYSGIITSCLLLIAACVVTPSPNPTPKPPALYDLSIVVTTHDVRLAGVTVAIDGFAFTTNANGFALDDKKKHPQVSPGDHIIKASKDGYTAVEQHWTITRHTRKVIGLNPVKPPFPDRNALRAWRGDFCGVPFQSPIGKPLIYTPMYPVFDGQTRAAMRAAYKARGYTHWPISVAGGYVENGHEVYPRFDYSQRPEDFRVFLAELWGDGLIPVVFLMDDHGPHDAGFLRRFIDVNRDLLKVTSIGWELNDWMKGADGGRAESTKAAKDLRAMLGKDALLYVHMTPEHGAMCAGQNPQNPKEGCEPGYWRDLRGIVDGKLYQAFPGTPVAKFKQNLDDDVKRLSGPLWGIGTMDVVAFEYEAFRKFRGGPEQLGIDQGRAAMTVPGVIGYGDGGPR